MESFLNDSEGEELVEEEDVPRMVQNEPLVMTVSI